MNERKEQVDNLNERIIKLKGYIIEINKNSREILHNKEVKVANLQNKTNLLTTQKNNLLLSVKDLNTQNQELIGINTELEDQNSDLIARYNNLLTELDEQITRANRLQTILTTKNWQIRDLQRDNFLLQTDNDNYEGQLDDRIWERDEAIQELNEVKNQIQGLENLLEQVLIIIKNVKSHLGISDLCNLPNTGGKTLLELINHACPNPQPCLLDHCQNNNCEQLANHICPVCPHADYQELKEQVANVPILLAEREQEIIKKIISELELDLNNNTSLEEVITKIKVLINKPDIISQVENSEELDYLKGLISEKEGQITSLQTDLDNSQKEVKQVQKIKEQALNLNLLLGIILFFSYLYFLLILRKKKQLRK